MDNKAPKVTKQQNETSRNLGYGLGTTNGDTGSVQDLVTA